MYDLEANEIEEQHPDHKRGKVSTGGTPGGMGRPTPVWHKDIDEDNHRPTQDTILKAHINPSSPFISLPNKLFQIVADAWMESFSGSSDDKPFCSIDKCIVLKACSDVKELEDFGLKLGSLNDTLMMQHKTEDMGEKSR